MRNFLKTLVAMMMFVATIAAITVSCKKEESARLNNGAAQTGQRMSPMEQNVLDFLADYDAMKRGAKFEEEAVCPEEACRLWETTLNYCYSFSNGTLSSMRLDTVRVTMPKVNEEDRLDYDIVMKTYENIVDAVRETYKTINMEGKTLQFVMMSIENGTAKDGNDEVVITMNTGSSNLTGIGSTTMPDTWYQGPFVEGDDWIWGLNRGKCDGSVTIGDAAQQLTLAIGHYDTIHWAEYVPCHGCQPYFIIDPRIEKYLYPTADSAWLFYVNGLTVEEANTYCIPWEDMNMYYERILQATHTEGMITNPFGVYGYYKTEVKDFQEIVVNYPDIRSNIWHEAWVYYAERVWRYSGDYPVPIGGDE